MVHKFIRNCLLSTVLSLYVAFLQWTLYCPRTGTQWTLGDDMQGSPETTIFLLIHSLYGLSSGVLYQLHLEGEVISVQLFLLS